MPDIKAFRLRTLLTVFFLALIGIFVLIANIRVTNSYIPSHIKSIQYNLAHEVCTIQKDIPFNNDTLNILLVGCASYCYNAKLAILSIMLFGKPQLKNKCVVHLIVDSDKCISEDDIDWKYIQSQLTSLFWLQLNVIKHKDIVFVGNITSINVVDAFEEMENSFKRCAGIRLFLPLIKQFENISVVLYLDSDVLCFKNIDEMLSGWNITDQMEHHMAMTTIVPNDRIPQNRTDGIIHYLDANYPINDFYGNTGLCSGVLFYNLDKARETCFLLKLINIYRWKSNYNGNDYYYQRSKEWILGDQDILNYHFAKHNAAKHLKILSCDWNIQATTGGIIPHYKLDSCKKAKQNSFILHLNNKAWDSPKYNQTYNSIKDIYKINNLAIDIETRNKLQNDLLLRWRTFM